MSKKSVIGFVGTVIVLAIILLTAGVCLGQNGETQSEIAMVKALDGRDTLAAPIKITDFIAQIDTGEGVLIQRNDALYQYLTVELGENGELTLRISAYLKEEEAKKIFMEAAERRFKN